MKMPKTRPQTKGTCFLDVSAEEAQNLLMTQGKDGNFVVRPSETESGNISLSVRHKGSVLHIKIQNTGELFDLYGGEQFASLFDLVEYYKDGEKLRLQDGDFICFSQPFFLKTTSDRCERWFHGGITSGAAKEKLKVQSEGSFLVRESQTKEETFVLSVKTGTENVTEVIINKTKGKYDIGDGASFKDLTNLIDHYRKKEITAMMPNKTKLNFTLKKAVNLGEILASDIPTRASELMKQFPGHDKARDGFWEEFEQIAKMEEMLIVYEMSRLQGKKEENVKKNRFKNILPYDETRVILKDHSEGDYINANYIKTKQLKVGDVTETYIATQGCLKQTVADFWRMVWQEKSSIIVMTTRVVEMGKNKCFQYWPEEEGQKLTFEFSNGSFTIEFESVVNSNDFYNRKLQVTREFKTKGKTESEKRVVHHFHFPEWPDKMAPKDEYIDRILDFIQAVNDKRSQLRDSKPLIVHCSAGIGRTGTYVLIDIILQMIKARGLQCPIDIPKILVEMRKMRSGLVQTEAQYRFVYLAIRHFIEDQQRKTTPTNSSSSRDIDENIYENQNQSKDNPSCRKPEPISPKPTTTTTTVETAVYENLNIQ